MALKRMGIVEDYEVMQLYLDVYKSMYVINTYTH